MIIEVSGPAGLRGLSERLAGLGLGEAPPDAVRIILAPGDYEEAVLHLDLPQSLPGATLVVESADPSRPTRFLRSRVALDAARLALTGLVLGDKDSDAPILRCRAETGITLVDCVLHHNTSTAKSGGRVVEFISGASQGASVQVRRSWFIENGATVEGSALVGIDGFGPNGFDRVVFEDVAFLGNRVSRGIEAVRAREVRMSRSLIASEADMSSAPFVLVPTGVPLDAADSVAIHTTDPDILARVCNEAVAQAEHGKPPDVDRLRAEMAEPD